VEREFPQVTIVRVSDHEFWTGATNAGIKLALADNVDFMLTINDDAVVDIDHVAKLVNLAQKHQLLILGNRIDYLEPKNKVWSLGTYSQWGTDRILSIAYNNADLPSIPTDILDREVIAVDALPGNGVLIHRSVFDRVGLYNAKFCPHYHGDSELIMRAQAAGISAWIAPQIVLANDFNEIQKQIPFAGLAGLKYTFFHPKSHLFALPIFYLIWRYCPRSQKLATLLALIKRYRNSPTS
jgi:GT2 family glycosyltransferase